MKDEKNRTIDVKEAGRRGGISTLRRRGRDFFRTIGKKGGDRTAELYKGLLKEFGKRGGRPSRPVLGGNCGEGCSKQKGGRGRPEHPSSQGGVIK